MAKVAAALVRARLLDGRGELRGAARVLSEIQTRREGLALPSWLDQEITLSLARLSVAMGRPDEALAAVAALDDHDSAQAAVVAATALVASGDTRRATELVRPVVDMPGCRRRC